MLVTLNNKLHSFSKKKHPTFFKNLVSFPFFCSVQSLVWHWSLTLGEWNTVEHSDTVSGPRLHESLQESQQISMSVISPWTAAGSTDTFLIWRGRGQLSVWHQQPTFLYPQPRPLLLFSQPLFCVSVFFLLSLSPTLLLGQISYTLC